MKIGILGGTFNPVHYGHLRAAEEVQKVFVFDKILFIPSGKPSFKKPLLVNARFRHEMTRIAVRGNPFFSVSDIETKNRGISYSVDTLRKLTDKYRNAGFYFILGIDAFLDVPKWKLPLEFLELTNLVIVSRPGYAFSGLYQCPYFTDVSRKTLREFDKGKSKKYTLNLETGRKAYFLKIPDLNISASCIRNLIKTGKSIKYLLPDSVESYIISNKLYK